MKSSKCWAVWLVAIVAGVTAEAGPRVGNGGGAWVCEERGGGIRWLQLVDLFEAEAEYGLELKAEDSRDPWRLLEERLAYAKRAVPSIAGLPLLSAADLRATLTMVPDRASLTRIDDDAIRVRPDPASCAGGLLYYGQLANFTFDGRLLIASNYWDHPGFGPRAQAALLLHELLYKALREAHGDETSSRARALTGILFSSLSAAEAEGRAVRILASRAIADGAKILRGPHRVFCEAHVEGGPLPLAEDTSVRWQLSAAAPELRQIGRLSFRAEADPVSGHPRLLAIGDAKSGARVSLRAEDAKAAFTRAGRVGLTFELPDEGSVGTMSCYAVSR